MYSTIVSILNIHHFYVVFMSLHGFFPFFSESIFKCVFEGFYLPITCSKCLKVLNDTKLILNDQGVTFAHLNLQTSTISRTSFLPSTFFAICTTYSREQKHVLLFRKSEILFFKVSNTNMPHIFLGTKLFCLLSK